MNRAPSSRAWQRVAAPIAALAVLATAAAPSAQAARRSEAPRKAAARPSGTFTMDFTGDFPTMDPVYWQDEQSMIPMQAVYQTLVTYNLAGTKIIPGAATWTASPNGLTYTFHLRPGLTFSNGDPVTAQDVVYSLNRVTAGDAAGPKGAAPYGSAYNDIVGYNAWFNGGKKPGKGVTGLSGLTAPNASTVVMHLVTPQAYFLNELALMSGVILDPKVVEKYGLAQYQLHAVGSGPYEMAYWHQGQQMVLVPNPRYTGSTPARISRVVFNVNVPFSTQFLYFKQGKVDMIDLPDQGTYLSALATPGMMKDFYKRPTNEIWYFSLNTTKPPFNKLDVRLAVNYAIDRETDLRLINGLGSLMNQPLPPGVPGYEKNFPTYKYDPALAKKLLKEAGYPHGFTVTLVYTSGRPFVQNVVENIQSQLARVGIKVVLKDIAQTGAYWPYETNPKNPFEIAWSDWYQDYPDPEDFLFDILDTQEIGSNNASGFSNATFDKLVQTADGLPASKEAERLKLYDQAQAIWYKDAPWVPMFYPLEDAFVQPWVQPHNLNVFVNTVRPPIIQDMYVTKH